MGYYRKEYTYTGSLCFRMLQCIQDMCIINMMHVCVPLHSGIAWIVMSMRSSVQNGFYRNADEKKKKNWRSFYFYSTVFFYFFTCHALLQWTSVWNGKYRCSPGEPYYQPNPHFFFSKRIIMYVAQRIYKYKKKTAEEEECISIEKALWCLWW